MQGNHCQYCLEMGNTVIQCPTITRYELCWKCKEKGHKSEYVREEYKRRRFLRFLRNHELYDKKLSVGCVKGAINSDTR